MWLIYALGGGWGHLTRAAALARTARRDRPVRILTNSPYAPIVSRYQPELDLCIVPADTPAPETRAAALQAISAYRPSHLIVDTFPRGLGGELAGCLRDFPARKVLVHRDLNPRYVASAQLCAFVREHYDLVLQPGLGAASQFASAIPTPPWLVRGADELPGAATVRSLLDLRPGDSCILVSASGKPAEHEWYLRAASACRDLAPHVAVRLVSPHAGISYWPAIDLLSQAAAVIGGAGYNTVEECLACGVPLIARPWPRTYDRQARRVWQSSARGRILLVDSPQDAADAALRHLRRYPWPTPAYTNGVPEAVARIAAS